MPELKDLANDLMGVRPFDPKGRGYDYDRARGAGMGPDGTGENVGHWGSVAPVTDEERKKHGLPDEAYVMLKGKKHATWPLGVAGENERGFDVIQLGDRHYSVPKGWKGK